MIESVRSVDNSSPTTNPESRDTHLNKTGLKSCFGGVKSESDEVLQRIRANDQIDEENDISEYFKISAIKSDTQSEDSGTASFDNDCEVNLDELGSTSNQVTEYIDEENFGASIDLTESTNKNFNSAEMVKAKDLTTYTKTKSPDLAAFNFYGEPPMPENVFDTPDSMFDDAFSLDEFMLSNQLKPSLGEGKWEQRKVVFQTFGDDRSYTRVSTCQPVANGEQDFLRVMLNEDEAQNVAKLQPFVNAGQPTTQPSFQEIRNRTFSDLLRGDMAEVDSGISQTFPICGNVGRNRDYSVSSDSGVGSSILMDLTTSPSNQSAERSGSSIEDAPQDVLTFSRNLKESVLPNSAMKNERFPSHVSDLSRHGEDLHDDLLLAELSHENGQIPGADEKVSSKKTAYNEKWGVKVFKAWCVDMSINEKFERLTPEQLNELLCRFWSEVRKSNGDYYGRNSLFNLRAMINKHLKGKPFCADFDIVTDERFRSSNDTLEKQLKILKGIGKTITHKQPISIADLRKMYDSNVLGTGSPLALLRKVWFEITLHFCHKGSEPQEKLTRSSFHIFRDHNYRAYISRAPNAKPGNDTDEIRMYETGGELCPVHSYQAYLQKLHPLQGRLFQQPRRKSTPTSPMWYGKAPIGEKALQQMMANISVAAKLSKRYTNHCVRTTALEQFSTSRKKSGGKSGDKTSQKSAKSNMGVAKRANYRQNHAQQLAQNNVYTQPQHAYYKSSGHLTYGQATAHLQNADSVYQYPVGCEMNPYENIPDQNDMRESMIPPNAIKGGQHQMRDSQTNEMTRCYKRTYEEITSINHSGHSNIHPPPPYTNQPTKRARLENCHVFLSRGGARNSPQIGPFIQKMNNSDLRQEFQPYGRNIHMLTSQDDVTTGIMDMVNPRKGLSETIIAGDSNIPEIKSITNQNFTVLTNII
uniref:uncharacterized protein LOC120329565 n=1 Tax=Styela clava TaxID=7725 RepID=UPI001939D0F2|nr:uncharacterized protein LOC120329565 [Styela clava]